MVTDQISDLLTRIRNAARVGHPSVRIPASKSKRRVLDLLVEEGYILGVEDAESEAGHPELKVSLKFTPGGESVIQQIERVSRPGRRMYVGKDDVPKFKSGLGVVVVSSNQGMISDREARKLGVGGELVCRVF